VGIGSKRTRFKTERPGVCIHETLRALCFARYKTAGDRPAAKLTREWLTKLICFVSTQPGELRSFRFFRGVQLVAKLNDPSEKIVTDSSLAP
jgi:hypothetical protein